MRQRGLNKNVKARLLLTLTLAATLLFGNSCYRKDLFLRVDQTQIAVEIYDIHLDLLWGVDWRTQWQYYWDESLIDFGVVGYTKPDLIKGTIYNIDHNTGKRISSFFKIFDSHGGRLSLTAGSTYDMMFYNFGTEWTSFYQSSDYEIYTASTRINSNATWIRTRAESENSEMPANSDTYIDYNQPDELFGGLVTDLTIDQDPTKYDKEIDADGNVTYIYRIDAALRPYSFIYLFQIIVLNNPDDKGDRIIGAKGLTITGLSQGVEMFSRITFNNTISITTEDVKPMQKHYNVRINDSTVVDSAYIMAARMLTWGLPGINPLEGADFSTKGTDTDKNYAGVGVLLRNNYTYPITVNITDQMHDPRKRAGGVINIIIDANDIPQEQLDRKEQGSGGGFDPHVGEWENEQNAEISI